MCRLDPMKRELKTDDDFGYGSGHRGGDKKSCRAGEKLRWALNFSSGPAVAENTTPGGECSVAGTIIKERKEVLNAFHVPVRRPSGSPPPADDIGARIAPTSLVAFAVFGQPILRLADNRIKHPHCRFSCHVGTRPGGRVPECDRHKNKRGRRLYFAVSGGRAIYENRHIFLSARVVIKRCANWPKRSNRLCKDVAC